MDARAVAGQIHTLLDALFEHFQAFRNNRAGGKELPMLGIGHTVQIKNGISPLKDVLCATWAS